MTSGKSLAIALSPVTTGAAPWAGHDTYYLTRDSADETGVLEDYVDVWAHPPIRSRALDGLGAIWMPSIGAAVLARVVLSEAQKSFLTLPETDREVVCYGGRP